MDEIFDLHTGTEARAEVNPVNDLKNQLCSTPGLGPRDFKKVEQGEHGVLATAAQCKSWARWPPWWAR